MVVTDKKAELAEFLSELALDNPVPVEVWKKRCFWDPPFKLSVIDKAEAKGYVETRGDRADEDYEFRYTALGRLACAGVEISADGKDGYAALERLKTSSPADAAAISALLGDLVAASLSSYSSGVTPSPTTALVQLNETLLVALRDVASYKAGPFVWKQASMKRLATMGLVEAWSPDGKSKKVMAHRITAAGRGILAKASKNG